MALIDSIVVFVVSLLVGALGIYLGARVITEYEDYTYAIVTALIGAIVWGIVGFLFGWIPLLGPHTSTGRLRHRHPVQVPRWLG